MVKPAYTFLSRSSLLSLSPSYVSRTLVRLPAPAATWHTHRAAPALRRHSRRGLGELLDVVPALRDPALRAQAIHIVLRSDWSSVDPHVAKSGEWWRAANLSPNCPVFAADAVSRVRQVCQRPTARNGGREWQCRFGNKATPSPSSPSRFERSGRPTLRPPTRRAPWSLSCGREA